MEDGLFESLDPQRRGRRARRAAALAIIARPVSLAPILAALAGRFGSAEIVPVHPRADTPAIRIVVRAPAGLARRACRSARRLSCMNGRRRFFRPRRRHQQRQGLAFRRLSRACGIAREPRMPTCFSTPRDRRTISVRRFFNRLLPKSMRSEAVTIPVIRLHGTIMAGGSQFRPTLSLASTAGLIEKAFALSRCARGRHLDQFAGRLAGAVAADLQAHPRPRGGEEQDACWSSSRTSRRPAAT